MTTQDLGAWIGRQETIHDNLDAGHTEKVALTLDEPAPGPGQELPLLWQWAYFIRGVPYAEIGGDGHPKRGGFLPPADDRNRMWAGGRLTFLQPLRVGSPAVKQSTILAINEKTGRTGKLLFVTVGHQYSQDGQLCIDEEQDIVYREPSPPRLQGSTQAPQAQWSETVEPSSIMLYRYSAVTFNGHRIHYDYPYVTQEEGYPGLVVHGPMLATLMCRSFRRANPDRTPVSLSYRGLRPLFSPRPFQSSGRIDQAGKAHLWIEQDDTLAHEAELEFK
ncbi:itaconyl-CoA hydratase [Allopusillimonas soli]|uniref:MaoC family dehydratase N-terminal domain-containing protein n=1 Tax=Allopusillimonas soli TaxID=659016 RepID=A0A853FJF3_9BURK|nr:MaoC family dehydratase N-terminal domain-containing protein [Allopusillimonas soli]NYT38521.1 MaoC family dehydratase N-terminal domain-containing protein [Allopusillimonas soli]TEA71758.1 itaconyl-CoA hydratase [Allopusillimonas soli]